MKNLITIVLVSISMISFSQLKIGTTTTTNSSVGMEFGTDPKAITLPIINGTTETGTLYIDETSDALVLKTASGTTTFYSSQSDITSSDTSADISDIGIIVGATSSTKKGVLVFEGTNKAPVMPNVPNPELTIKNPELGMLVYDSLNKKLKLYIDGDWKVL